MACKPVGIKDDVLNDLATRFLINIPDEDKDDPLKLCSHIEVAYWFYLDLIRPEDPTLPGCSMKEFMATIFKHCPFLVRDSVAQDLDTLQTQWKSHKYRKPTRGAIILNHNLTKCLLVQGYPASTSWGFPKGKLERGESDMDCAIREVYEETGFDIRALIQSEHYLECQSQDSERASRMYIIPSVAEETEFKPRVRKEIRDIAWFRVEDLPRHKKDLTTRHILGKNPNSFFMIIPFISQLKRWITTYQRRKDHSKKNSRMVSATFHTPSAQQQQQQQQRQPRKASSSPLPARTSGGGMVGGGQNTSPQSVPKRSVSGPVGMRPGTYYSGMGTPLVGQPGMGTPLAGHPGMGTPLVGQPGMGTPLAGHPGMGTPLVGQPGMGTPLVGQPGMGTPLAGHPGMGTPLVGQPGMGTPLAGHPGMGLQRPGTSVAVQHQLPPPMRSHSIPHSALPLRAPHGYVPSPSHHHHPPTLPPHSVIPHTHAPVPRRALLPTPHSTHLPPSTSAPSQYVPRPTSVFNPVVTTSAFNPPTSNFKSVTASPGQTATANPAISNSNFNSLPTTEFNPFAALGISTANDQSPTRSKVLPGHLPPFPIPYQWHGNGTVFRPVQVQLQPAQALVRFEFDKTRILSASG